MELRNKRLALFFTKGVSLETWDKVGNLNRELKLYNELARYFKEIYFFSYGSKNDLKYQRFLSQNIKIFPKRWNLPSLIFSLLLPFFYQKELSRTDILKTNQMVGAWTAVLAKRLYKKKLIVRCGYEWLTLLKKQKRNFWKRKIAYFIEKISYKAADKIVLTSKEDKDFVENKFKVFSSRVKLIPNYIDNNSFKPLRIEKIKGRIIFIGRLEKEKNLFNLIEAIASLPTELIIVGSGFLKKKLENFAIQKKANVEFRRTVPNNKLPEELNKSTIFILPSFYEGCPKVLLEAMACALPCVGANVKGIREIINHKENGYLCETDVFSIKKALFEILNNETLQQKLSQNARKTILEKFSLEKILKKELEIYQSS